MNGERSALADDDETCDGEADPVKGSTKIRSSANDGAVMLARRAMDEANDTPGNIATCRWAIVAQARTGSTLLADMLHNRGAGFAAEYLNPLLQAAYRRRFSIAGKDFRLDKYLEHVCSLRTTGDGMFGMKCLHVQLVDAYPKTAAMRRFLERFDRFILLSRRDRLAQAVSAMKAQQTGQWNSWHPKEALAPVTFDPLFISKRIERFHRQNRTVQQALAGIDRPVLPVEYEDMVGDLPGCWRRVQAFLGLDPVPVATAQSDLQRQADAENERLARQYVDYLRGG
jgi:LPS sulfotransferase NodH